MHILMSNDDGILAPGLRDLADYLASYHRVTVVAPTTEQSGKSHALTTEIPLTLDHYSDSESNPNLYALKGTPTDCVKFGLSHLLPNDRPDLVISGINDGFNLGSDVLYSGTVSAAMEGCFYQIPSLALSVQSYTEERGREMHAFIKDIIDTIFIKHAFKGLLNVNFPKNSPCDWDHFKIVNQGLQTYSNIFDERVNTRGQTYYWLAGTLDHRIEEYPTDVEYIRKGFITAVPLTWKQQNDSDMEILKNIVKNV